MTTLRTFFAIDLPEELQTIVATNLAPLIQNTNNQHIRWVAPKNWHLTLRFLGNINQTQLQCIINKVTTALASIPQFAMALTELALFPQVTNAHTLIFKTTALVELTQLALTIDREVTTCGIAPDKRPFKPHLTVARLNRKFELPANQINLATRHFPVDAVKLYQSIPSTNGSTYIQLHSFGLK